MYKFTKKGGKMRQIINYIKSHKAQAITVITGALSLLVAINKDITMSAKTGLVITFVTVALSILLSIIQTGFSDETIRLIVRAIQIIQEIVANEREIENEENKEVVSSKRIVMLTEDEIKERLIEKD
jgi:ABC-type multidrug transport system fused ATPase/permease subunit